MTVTQLHPADPASEPGVDPELWAPRLADLDAETSVLGSCLLAPRAVDDAIEAGVTSGSWWQPRHALIWDAITRIAADGIRPDAVTVAARLRDLGALVQAGGPAYLHTLISGVPVAGNAGHYARIVVAHAQVRAIEQTGRALILAAVPGADPAALLEEARQQLDQVAALVHGRTHDPSMLDVCEAAFDAIERGVVAWPTGIPGLDRIIRGWTPGALVVVGARPGVGKSAFALQSILETICTQGEPAGFSSLEMPASQLLHRAWSHLAKVDHGRLQQAHTQPLTEAEWRALSKAKAQTETGLLQIVAGRSCTTADIRADIRAHTRRVGRPVRVWTVDYCQLVTPSDRRVPREQQISGITRDLKLTAQELECEILLLSQLNRGPTQRANAEPTMADLRESGALEQDADTVILLHRDLDDEPDQLVMKVAKSRHTSAGHEVLGWVGHHQTITDGRWSPSDVLREDGRHGRGRGRR